MIGKSIAAKAFNPFTGGTVNICNDNTNNNVTDQKPLAITTLNHQIEPWMQEAFASSKFEVTIS